MLSVFAGSAILGVLDRLRGWGNTGWNRGDGTKWAPKWLVWLQVHVFSRVQLSFASALVVYLAGYAIGHEVPWWTFPIAAGLWLLGWARGKGEYQDGRTFPNNELPEIDWLLLKLQPYLKKGQEPLFMDALSMALRGYMFIPLFLFYGWVYGWLAAVLPILFFWQEGWFYWKIKLGQFRDRVQVIELASGTVRGLVILAGMYMMT